MIYFFSLLMSMVLFLAPASFAGYKDVDTKIAEQEISSHILKDDVRFTFRLQKGGFEKGVEQGMWDADGKLTARAASSKLKSLKRSGTGDLLISSQNADIKVKITDIKEMSYGMKFKQARFTWQYDTSVPSLWKRYIVAGGTGFAAFAVGNDGWRFDGMELGYSDDAFHMTWTELNEEKKEMQQIGAAMDKEEESKRRSQSERQKRIEESKKAGKNFGTFSLSTSVGQESCSVSDVGVNCQKDGVGGKQSYSIMFVDVRDVRKTSYPGPDSKQFYAIELTMRDLKRGFEGGTGGRNLVSTSWRNVGQWISVNKGDSDKFFDVLARAHKEWRAKFSDIAE